MLLLYRLRVLLVRTPVRARSQLRPRWVPGWAVGRSNGERRNHRERICTAVFATAANGCASNVPPRLSYSLSHSLSLSLSICRSISLLLPSVVSAPIRPLLATRIGSSHRHGSPHRAPYETAAYCLHSRERGTSTNIKNMVRQDQHYRRVRAAGLLATIFSGRSAAAAGAETNLRAGNPAATSRGLQTSVSQSYGR